MLKERVVMYLKESKEKLRSAEKNIELGFIKTAAHEIYYAAENAARALVLALEGNVPRDKASTWRKIRDFKRRGVVTKYVPEEIQRCYAYRRRVDYVEIREEIKITEEGIKQAFKISQEFVNEAERILKDENFI